MSSQRDHDRILRHLRKVGLVYPRVHFKSPWPGHMDLAVKDKTFAYLSLEGEPLGISCKLPHSCAAALMLPNTKPTAYGLGKSGWVSASFELGQPIDVSMLEAWLDESYRAQAPKTLVKLLDSPEAATSKKTGKKKTKKKTASTSTSTSTSTKRKKKAGKKKKR